MEKQSLSRHKFKTHGINRTLAAFALLVIIYITFGIINTSVFANTNNLLRSMSICLLVTIGQSYVMITGNIDLSIGSVVGMSAMISETLMHKGIMSAPLAVITTIACCIVVGFINGTLVGKSKLPSYIVTWGTMFFARGVAYLVNGNRNTSHIAGIVRETVNGEQVERVVGIGKEAAEKFQNFSSCAVGYVRTIKIPTWAAPTTQSYLIVPSRSPQWLVASG